MTFISFVTNDTCESIPNKFSNKPTFTIYMLDNKGNVWQENNYEGNGIFSGKDFFELLAEINGIKYRDEAVRAYLMDIDEKDSLIYPNIVRDIKKWRKWKNVPIYECEQNGYFYTIPEEDGDESYNEYYDDYDIDDTFDD